MEDFERECKQGVEWGMDGKTLIHPKQLQAANAAFGPTAADVERSKRVIAAHAKANSLGQGVVLLDGQVVEKLHVRLN
jgi:citrate lyase subunit beta/citryl-CoA lyase